MAGAEPDASGRGDGAGDGREALTAVQGPELVVGMRSALAWLQANQDAINDLNVFPVPDGDTGSNMYLTLRSAVEDMQKSPDPSSASAVMQAAAHGSLMGARGNSGVILSQVLRGFAQGLQGRSRVDASGIATALGEASTVAYKAVMKPTEGTILTVVREAAGAARTAAESSDDIRTVFEAAVREAHAAVERTPEQLAVLREAGVVDAGGFGFAVILEGLARSVAEAQDVAPQHLATHRRVGEPQLRPPVREHEALSEGRRGAAAVAARDEGWGYCTEFLVHGPGIEVELLRDELSALGESSLVVGDAELVRVHIHTFEPANLIAVAAQRGRLSKLKVEDMSQQHHDVLERAAEQERLGVPGDGAPGPVAAPRRALGVVPVAPGDGFREILLGLGAAAVVEGGQTMNPSIEDLLNAVRAANADSVIILPNNKNVILTAQQVDALADGCDVRVVATRNLPQGISAMLAVDPNAELDDNCARMEEARRSVEAVEVTRAVRDSSVDGKEIHTGDVLAVVDDHIAQVGDSEAEVLDRVLAARPEPPELVTLYRGVDAGEADARALVDRLRSEHPDTEFELHDGGQEHYPYILSIE